MVVNINELRAKRMIDRNLYKGIDLFFALYQSMHYFYTDLKYKHVFINNLGRFGFIYPKNLNEAKKAFREIKQLAPAHEQSNVIEYDLMYWTDVLAGQFISTRESIDSNSVIIGFFNITTRDYTRYLIKDEKKIIDLFCIPKSSPNKLRIRVEKENLAPQILELVELTKLPVKDKYIKAMLDIFSEGYSTVKQLFRR
jgi:hypothetical protein